MLVGVVWHREQIAFDKSDAAAMLPAGHQQTASPFHYTTSCKHSLVRLRMGEIIARNMLS